MKNSWLLVIPIAFVALSIAWQWHVMWINLFAAVAMVACITATIAGTVATFRARMALGATAIALVCVAGVFGCIATGIYGVSVTNPTLIYLAIVGFVFLSSFAVTIDDRPIY